MARFVTKEQSKQTQSSKILEYKQLFYLFTFFLMYVLTWRHQASPSHHSVAKWGSSFLSWLPPTPSSPTLIVTSTFLFCSQNPFDEFSILLLVTSMRIWKPSETHSASLSYNFGIWVMSLQKLQSYFSYKGWLAIDKLKPTEQSIYLHITFASG